MLMAHGYGPIRSGWILGSGGYSDGKGWIEGGSRVGIGGASAMGMGDRCVDISDVDFVVGP